MGWIDDLEKRVGLIQAMPGWSSADADLSEFPDLQAALARAKAALDALTADLADLREGDDGDAD